MNIEIKVDDVTLDTIVAKTIAYDEDGDAYESGEQTVAQLVAQQIVTKLVADDRWPKLRDHVLDIRTEEIRAAVRPSIDAALNRPIHKTNTYGERTGQETTLSELIVDEARKQLGEPVDRYSREKGTVLQSAIRTEVRNAFAAEIADAVKQARDLVIGELGGELSQQVTKAITEGLRKR